MLIEKLSLIHPITAFVCGQLALYLTTFRTLLYSSAGPSKSCYYIESRVETDRGSGKVVPFFRSKITDNRENSFVHPSQNQKVRDSEAYPVITT